MRSLILITALALPFGASAQLTREAPDELASSLTERVSAFYRDFQNGQFRHAESFVDEESKELYYNVRKTRIMGHEIKGYTWADDFRSVRVMVTALTILPMMGSKPLPVPVGSEWNLIDGDWFMHLTAPEERKSTPFGDINLAEITSGNGAAIGLPQGGTTAPSIAALRRMVSFDRTSVSFPAATTEPITHVIAVTSRAPEGFDVTLEPIRKAPNGMTVVVAPEKVAPGDDATITVTYDSSLNRLSGVRRLDFEVSPTGQRLRLTVDFTEPAQVTTPDQLAQ